jgi:DNA-binding GntR family transcriptional regulator
MDARDSRVQPPPRLSAPAEPSGPVKSPEPLVQFAPLVQENLHERVQAQIMHAIHDGTLAPGQRLVEDRIAASLHVSRAPVREALRVLEREGLVEAKGRRGRFVAQVSAHDAWEVYTLRSALEGMAFHLAAGRASAEALQDLSNIVEEMRRVSRTGDRKLLSELDTRFHETACRLSGNVRLYENWLSMFRQIRHLSGRVLDTLYSDLNEVPGRHEHLVDLLAAGDPAAAEAAARSHIDPIATRIINALQEIEQRRGGPVDWAV